MTGERGDETVPAGEAAAHLDEDAEAIEDPVHSGDARHQHEVHAQQRRPAGS